MYTTLVSAQMSPGLKEELLDAVMKGDLDRVVNVIERGGDIDAVLNKVSVDLM